MKMLQVQGIDKLKKDFKQSWLQFLGQGQDVIVGFSQNYAVFVHENLEARHKTGKQAKYLTSALKKVWPAIPYIVRQITKKGQSISKGLLVAGLRIQREAQKVVPIDTGALRASAYTTYESTHDAVASSAHMRSEKVREKKIESRKKRKKKGKKK